MRKLRRYTSPSQAAVAGIDESLHGIGDAFSCQTGGGGEMLTEAGGHTACLLTRKWFFVDMYEGIRAAPSAAVGRDLSIRRNS